MNIKAKTLLTAAALAAAAYGPAVHAATFALTFDALADSEPVAAFYAGGTGGYGSGPGPNYTVSLDPNLWAFKTVAGGGSGVFTGNPSGTGALVLANGDAGTIDIAYGITRGLGFSYVASSALTVSVYDALDGGGTLLATQTFAPTAGFASFAAANLVFGASTAKSIVLSGVPITFAIDDLALVVPEPGALVMLGLGAAIIGTIRRRARSLADG